MYQFIIQLKCDYLCNISLKENVVTDEGTGQNEGEHTTKRWNWSNCTKMTLSSSWAPGRIAQSIRASERNSLVVGSNPTQANFL